MALPNLGFLFSLSLRCDVKSVGAGVFCEDLPSSSSQFRFPSPCVHLSVCARLWARAHVCVHVREGWKGRLGKLSTCAALCIVYISGSTAWRSRTLWWDLDTLSGKSVRASLADFRNPDFPHRNILKSLFTFPCSTIRMPKCGWCLNPL